MTSKNKWQLLLCAVLLQTGLAGFTIPHLIAQEVDLSMIMEGEVSGAVDEEFQLLRKHTKDAIIEKQYDEALMWINITARYIGIKRATDELFFLMGILDIHLLKKDEEKVVQILKEYYPQHEEDLTFLIHSSRIHCYIGKFENAIDDLTKAIEIVEKRPELLDDDQKDAIPTLYFMRASMYAHLDDFSKARADIEKVGFTSEALTETYKFFENCEKHVDGLDFAYVKQEISVTRTPDGAVQIHLPCHFTLVPYTTDVPTQPNPHAQQGE